MATTVTVGDGTTEVFEPKAKTPLKAVPKPEIEAPKEPEPAETVEAVDDDTDTDSDDSDSGDGALPEYAKKAIAKLKRSVDKKHRGMREADEMAREQFEEAKNQRKRAEDAEAKLAEMESRTAAAKEKVRTDFKDDEEWIDYRVKRANEAEKLAQAQAALKAEQDAMQAGRVARNATFAKTVPDWESTMESLAGESFSISPAMEQFFYESDASAQVLYHLGKHPDLYADIAKLKPTRQIKALGDLENELVKPAAKAEKSLTDAKPSISKAPAPTTSISEGATPQQKDPQKMSTDEYLAYARQRRIEKARLGRN